MHECKIIPWAQRAWPRSNISEAMRVFRAVVKLRNTLLHYCALSANARFLVRSIPLGRSAGRVPENRLRIFMKQIPSNERYNH